MKEQIPTTVETEAGAINFSKIHQNFSNTENGAVLSSNIRYGRYKPDSVSKEVWEELLGADVNNLDHLKLTYGLTRQFIKYALELEPAIELSLEEQEDLLLAATIHDWAESIVGDVPYDLKTDEEESNENLQLENLLRKQFGSDKKLLERSLRVLNEVVKDRSTKLGKIFNAVERVGYMRTGLNAWANRLKPGLEIGLEQLTNNVLLNQIPKLIEYAGEYPAIALYLQNSSWQITEAFAKMSDESFEEYGDDAERYRTQFKDAESAWKEYTDTFESS